jgi:SAM-dependent methyltransferase
VIHDQKLAEGITRADLSLAMCEECGFIFNQTFDLSKLSYGESYENSQTSSSFFSDYMDTLVRYLVFEKGVRNCRIVEVGCGKGSFLRKLVEVEEWGNSGIGYDPSYVGPPTDLEGRLRFECHIYGPQCAIPQTDVVLCRHVIEHVPDPLAFLLGIRQALSKSIRAKVFFETPCVEWILRNRVVWDFFYEHCSYFTRESLTTAFEVSGFRAERVSHVFGDQYLWLEATIAPQGWTMTKNPGCIPRLAREFAELESELTRAWKGRTRELANRGNLAVWGAGAKGVTFANLVDPHRKLITCMVDVNPKKQGHYIPGSGHPVVSPQQLADYDVDAAILMNPNYRDENLAILRKSHLNVDLIDLMKLCKGGHGTHY